MKSIVPKKVYFKNMRFSAYHMFNKVPVVVTSYSITLPEEVDYVPVKVGTTVTHVPTRTNIMVNLEVTYTPQKLRRQFSLDKLTSGEAYKDGFI